MTDLAFPRPARTGDAAPFWEACRGGRLAIQACGECGELRHPPRPFCAACGSSIADWHEVSGRGEVWSFTIVHPPTIPAFADRVPYTAVVVRLDEGPFLVSNLLDIEASAVVVGMAVDVCFEAVDEHLTLPLFRPVTH